MAGLPERLSAQNFLSTVGFNSGGSSGYHDSTCGYHAQALPQLSVAMQHDQCTACPANQGLGQYGSSICQTTHSTSLHPVSKKGIGVWQMPTLEADIANADVSWFYSWGPCMGDFHKPANTEFVPMIWGRDDLSSNLKILQDTAQHQHLLGFNEPDIPSQANMSVEQAIEAWPLLMSTGLRLGSPAVADPPDGSDHDWLGRFMSLAAAHGFRIDFMCVHYYSRLDTFDIITNVNALFNLLHKIHNKWQRPIWLTEFAMINWWGGNIGKYASAQEQADFMRACADMIDTLPFVERYAWFALHKDNCEATNGLYDEHGILTDVGQAFQQLQLQ